MTARCTAVLALAAIACSAEPSAGDAAADAGVDAGACVPLEAPSGLLASPADLDVTGCDLAAFDASSLSGLHFVHTGSGGSLLGGVARFSTDECGRLAVDPATYIDASDNGVFVRSEVDYGTARVTEAYLLCAPGDAPGELRGSYGICTAFDGSSPRCATSGVTVRPFERIDGESDADGFEELAAFAGGGDPWPHTQTTGIRVRDGLAYIAMSDGLRIVDVGDPTAPADVGALAVGEDFVNDIDVVASGDAIYALLASQGKGVLVVNVTDPAAPELIGALPFGLGDFGAHRIFTEPRNDGTSRLYMVDGGSPIASIWNVTDPAAPVHLGDYALANSESGFHDLFVADDVMYLADISGNALRIVDASAPAAAVEVGHTAADPRLVGAHSAWVARIAGRTVAVTSTEGYDTAVSVVDVDPASETFLDIVGAWKLRPEVSAHHLVVAGDTAYVTHYQDGLRVLDLSDPTAPRQVAYANTWDPAGPPGRFVGAYDVAVAEDAVFVVDWTRGLVVLRHVTE